MIWILVGYPYLIVAQLFDQYHFRISNACISHKLSDSTIELVFEILGVVVVERNAN